MTVLNESSLPYPGMDLAAERAKQHARAAGVDTAPAPVHWYAPGLAASDVPAGAAFAAPTEPTFEPLRRPGASLATRPVPVPPAGRVTNLALLTRVRDSLRKSEAELADERARYELAEIVYAAAKNAEPPYGPYCPDCQASGGGWCDGCLRAGEKAEGLYRLHDLILAADTYATAVVLVARPVLPIKVIYTEGRR